MARSIGLPTRVAVGFTTGAPGRGRAHLPRHDAGRARVARGRLRRARMDPVRADAGPLRPDARQLHGPARRRSRPRPQTPRPAGTTAPTTPGRTVKPPNSLGARRQPPDRRRLKPTPGSRRLRSRSTSSHGARVDRRSGARGRGAGIVGLEGAAPVAPAAPCAGRVASPVRGTKRSNDSPRRGSTGGRRRRRSSSRCAKRPRAARSAGPPLLALAHLATTALYAPDEPTRRGRRRVDPGVGARGRCAPHTAPRRDCEGGSIRRVLRPATGRRRRRRRQREQRRRADHGRRHRLTRPSGLSRPPPPTRRGGARERRHVPA